MGFSCVYSSAYWFLLSRRWLLTKTLPIFIKRYWWEGERGEKIAGKLLTFGGSCCFWGFSTGGTGVDSLQPAVGWLPLPLMAWVRDEKWPPSGEGAAPSLCWRVPGPSPLSPPPSSAPHKHCVPPKQGIWLRTGHWTHQASGDGHFGQLGPQHGLHWEGSSCLPQTPLTLLIRHPSPPL